jgi:serine/threonine protein kinase
MVLPPAAAFCGKCGERLEKPDQRSKEMLTIDRSVNLERYRITALMRRAPYVQLSLAMDTQQHRPVAIRDIDIQQIDTSSHSRIFKALQQEYDLLRRQKNKDVLPLIASFHAQNHLYSISAWPLTTGTSSGSAQGTIPTNRNTHIYTMQDVLQSGIGLPEEQIALSWTLRLANAVEHLHRDHIVIGTLDPSTILVNQKDYSGEPSLFPSWMPPAVQSQLQQALNTANTFPLSHITPDRTAFFSPEAKQGQPEMRSDIYSMGALLYLLMTGIAPSEQSRSASKQLRSPREINPRIQHTLATIILKALSGEPSARFQNVHEFVAALLEQQVESKVFQRLSHTYPGHNRPAERAGIPLPEMNVTSDKDNNKTEQGKAAQTNQETNDDTISIGPIPQRLTRHYLSHINTPQEGQEPLKSEQEESIVETGHSEQTMQLTKEEMQQAQGTGSAQGTIPTVAKVVAGAEEGSSAQNTSENTDSVNEGEPDTDNQSSRADTEEGSKTQTLAAEREQNKQEPNDNTATSLESHEQIPLREHSQPDSSVTEGPTDSENASPAESEKKALSHSPLRAEVLQQDKRALSKTFAELFERVKRFVLDGQARTNNAVAMIETPMRIQPNKNYTLRIHIMGRNEPKHVSGFKQRNDATVLSGLSSLICGERVHIEVRSALYHNYAYIVQQTDVEIPATNYAAEITIPMRSITDGTGTKRERLHIFFTDQKQNPLYEKPFVVELFISNLVQSGNEGHNVLAIPL